MQLQHALVRKIEQLLPPHFVARVPLGARIALPRLALAFARGVRARPSVVPTHDADRFGRRRWPQRLWLPPARRHARRTGDDQLGRQPAEHTRAYGVRGERLHGSQLRADARLPAKLRLQLPHAAIRRA